MSIQRIKLARRIERINYEYATARMQGRPLASFIRRARNLSRAYLDLP
jgi:hypothetical protein